jgi:cytoskeletal protein CcmA (bactofilin family)
MVKHNNIDVSLGDTTLISTDTHITGDLHFSGNLEIEGKITGSVVSSAEGGRVRIMPTGHVIGDIHTPIAVINGRIEGNIYSSEEIHLAADSFVEGNLYYVLLEIEKGAQMNGTFVYQPNQDDIRVLESPVETSD